MKQDVVRKYHKAQETFSDAATEDQEFLQTFSFICMLSFDVYVKKMLIEKLIDSCSAKETDTNRTTAPVTVVLIKNNRMHALRAF